MRIKDAQFKYNVLVYDWNKKRVIPYNILSHIDAKEIAKKIKNEEITNRISLTDYVDRQLRYYCWSRAEYEIMVGDLCGRMEEFDKIDAYYQATLNFDMIINHIVEEMRLPNEFRY